MLVDTAREGQASFLTERLSNASPKLLRRHLLQAALTGAAATLRLQRATAQQKMSQVEAEYQDRPKNGLTCSACTLFRPPRSCEVVRGDISPYGWCRFFDLPD